MEGLWQDLRYARSAAARTPRNSAIAVAILALGIGANTAMFSAVNHVLLLPLPFTIRCGCCGCATPSSAPTASRTRRT